MFTPQTAFWQSDKWLRHCSSFLPALEVLSLETPDSILGAGTANLSDDNSDGSAFANGHVTNISNVSHHNDGSDTSYTSNTSNTDDSDSCIEENDDQELLTGLCALWASKHPKLRQIYLTFAFAERYSPSHPLYSGTQYLIRRSGRGWQLLHLDWPVGENADPFHDHNGKPCIVDRPVQIPNKEYFHYPIRVR
ncbi:hypothetical protein HGRIS_004232 [Hohenbuehelia grisea]|uniref:Uncharacterized protein n=1 Tax=Hohenbuehelia grisea TaxID=104357 RepID=A0ABR3IP64_9AGAR